MALFATDRRTAMTTVAGQSPTSTLVCRPRYEGANIRTWIGFKHFMFLVEEAILQWFRDRDWGPRRLFHEYGLGLELLDSSVLLPALLEIDDEVEAEVTARHDGRFRVMLHIRRNGSTQLALRGAVTVALVPERAAPVAPSVPPELRDLVREMVDGESGPALASHPDGAFRWDWVARYFHCHFSDRVQHSAYTRALEEVVDRFLADRGMSIATMLETRGWIPVVSRARVELLGAARMEELITTRFAVTQILKGTAFDATMQCHVERDGVLVPVARATILHGYAASRGERAGALVELDEGVQERLLSPVGVTR
jgi:acyl-CoA thioesterase FadM